MQFERGGNVLHSVAGGPASGAGADEPVTHVLSTLESDGSRRWLRPRLSKGGWWHKRRIVAYLLMVVFVAIPHLRIGGKPFILLDVVARQFTVLGRTFYPTDSILLALLLLSVFISIVLLTAIAGRAWCGWACPQTVYMEFMFRPLDRFFDGTVGKGGRPARDRHWGWQVAKFGTYLLLCMFLAHTFLAYFVGTEKLADWIRSSPIQHPAAFLVMAATTGLMMFDFLFFREQMCLIACPYGRFQSVMLDEQSLIVAYDHIRGEPRKKGKRKAVVHSEMPLVGAPADTDTVAVDGGDAVHSTGGAGDCVDCNQCVVVCPTGIDIRDGLQMECINCTQCIDACDSVMDKVKLPRGLIRYSSQDAIDRKPRKMVRARTIVYPLILSVVLGGFAFAIGTKSGFDARILRGKGNPFTIQRGGLVSNSFHLRLVNRTNEPKTYRLQVVTPEQTTLEVIDDETTTLNPGDSKLVPFSIRFPTRVTFGDGNEAAELKIDDGGENERTLDFRLLGPRT
ncbi:Ubp3 associated protein Bre5 [Rubripirellula lacrimiformis]|uniref:Ubp3 associated protein Bre5 n=1 Tax=Rubripirellula lacrimiformis TaxID=1930273 RepID=A0A517N9L9_9BACT|nr:cytochrome c oxidase accessory protein CcoG [Rubripirellula lacrimiformis]QDT03835.1 Ubp3 associated protein Bre5 [Rubripirellula lacrimiformis]